MAAPTIVNTAIFATTTSNASPTFDVPVPPGSQSGDILIMTIRGQATTATAHFSHAEWSLESPEYSLPSANRRVSDILSHAVTSDPEPATYTFTRPANSGTQRCTGVVHLVRGGSVVIATGITEGTTYGGHVVPGDSDTLTILAAMAEFVTPNNHAGGALPGGWAEAGASVEPASGSLLVSRTAVRSVSQADIAPVPSTALPFVGTNTAPVTVAVTIEAADAPIWPVTVYDGAEELPAVATVYNGTVEQEVVQILVLPSEPYTLTQMDAAIAADELVYWAHRGGSLNWSEMTMRAYTNATWHGARALEVSLHRSLDGVWIMIHDADTDRVTATNHVVATTLSSVLLGIPVDVPTTGGVLGRIEDLLTAYSSDLVLLIDNKPQTNRAELFALIKSMVPDWADRIIWKIDGANSTTIFQEADAEGFKVAGYWFDGAVSTTLPAREPFTDYIGLNYNATVGDWNIAAAYGKPMWAHVLSDVADMNTGIARGALIMQCADVLELIPQINEVP